MSTLPAPRSLFDRLVDDAAVFPPGNAPVPVAWAEHLAMRSGRYGDVLGPLLIGAAGADVLVEAAAAHPPVTDHETAAGLRPAPVAVGVVARAGTSLRDLRAAVAALRASPHLRVVSVELPHDTAGAWREALGLGARVAVEVTRDLGHQHDALDDLAAGASRGTERVVAKLRTQSTPTAPVPTPRELAEFMHGARDRDLPFKLTGGLHHAVAHTELTADPSPEEQHGVLNVVVAAHHLEQGATLRDLIATLELRETAALTSLVRGLSERDVDQLRARFLSFGCCGVMDPVGELVDLTLLTP
ncbi:hypothetical protein [Ornithinimicrobium pekingense]|nr:hypothetical protein [Ornithinimicrobium pekingense]